MVGPPMPAPEPLRIISVMIVDDHAMFREAMSVALSQYPNIIVPFEAASAEEALAILRDRSPDVVLMDISLPGMSGIEATRAALEIRSVPVIALSMHDRAVYEATAIAAGAKGYAVKADPVDELVSLIESVAERSDGD